VDNRDWAAPRGPSPADFISQHPVFRIEEAEAWYRDFHRGGLEQARRTIRYHLSTGRLRRLRRDVYVERTCIDPVLVASRLVPDAIIAFDGALSIRDLPDNPYNLTYVTQHRAAAICFHDTILQPLRLARETDWRSFYCDSIDFDRGGFTIRATKLERTFVDCLDRLDRAPDLPRLIDAFRGCGALNFERLLELVHARQSPLLAARLGFTLHCARRLPPIVGGSLMHLGLQRPDYFLRTARGPDDSIIAKWNLIVSPEQRALYEAARNA
jgi:predicted transcriptional regulator of viral defense system